MDIKELLSQTECNSIDEVFNLIEWLKENNQSLKEALNNIIDNIKTVKELL